jgi:hypothetical protein
MNIWGSLKGGQGNEKNRFLMIMFPILIIGKSSFAEIEIKYDKFKDITKVQTHPQKTGGTKLQPALVLIGDYAGRTPSTPKVCQLAFALKGSSWAYLDCHSLSCLADGSPVKLPSSKHDGRVGKGYVMELISIMIPFSIIEQLSKCEKAEFKPCNTEFTLTKQEMQDLGTFMGAFKESR